MKKFIFLAVLAIGVISCSVENDSTKSNDEIRTVDLSFEDEICGDAFWTNFSDLGSIVVFNDAQNLTVRFLSHDPEGLIQANLAIVDSYQDFPINGGGNLPPGQMGESIQVGGDWFAQFNFPLSNFQDFEDGCLLIAPRAIFKANQGVHVAGNLPLDSEEPWYFEYCIQTCEPVVPQPVIVCESAYMFGNIDLIQHYAEGEGGNNWGWAANMYLADGASITEPLYAAAGRNLLENAVYIGDVRVSRSGTAISAEVINLQGNYTITNQHVYLGNILPGKRLGPGRFSNNGDADGYFVIMVHAEVCWEVSTE